MAGTYTLFRQFDNTKDTWKALVMVTRVWEVLNLWTNVVQSIDFILMDEEGSQIHGRVDPIHYDNFRDLLREGTVLELENFIVEEKKKKKYCPVQHRYNIILKANTKMQRSNTSVTFPKQQFHFVEFEDLPVKIDNDEYLTDVVGIYNHLSEIKDVGMDKKTGKVKRKRDLIIENKSGKTLRMTIWENCFSLIPEALYDIGQRVVLILTSATVRKFGPETYLQATLGTKIYINMEIPEVALLLEDIARPPVEWKPTGKRLLSVDESKCIAEVRCALEDSIQGEHVCVCTVSKVFEEEKWYYISCEKCKRKINDEKSFCDRCSEAIGKPTPRFKLQLEIYDNTGSIRVTVFDNEATGLLNIFVNEMIDMENKENGDLLVSEKFKSIIGTSHLFLLKISEYNINHPTAPLTVAKITAYEGGPMKRVK